TLLALKPIRTLKNLINNGKPLIAGFEISKHNKDCSSTSCLKSQYIELTSWTHPFSDQMNNHDFFVKIFLDDRDKPQEYADPYTNY
ncbi:6526_t:CDS:2, partial [Dentiscutata heterogama]